MNYEVVVQRDLVGEGFFFAGDKLMVFDLQVVVLNESLTLEIECGHLFAHSFYCAILSRQETPGVFCGKVT